MDQHLDSSNDEINLFEYWGVIKARKLLIGIIVVLITIGTAIVSIFSPITYKADAVIMPVGKGGGGGLSSAMRPLGGTASLVGVGGGQTALQQFMALLGTRTLAEYVINKCDLLKVFGTEGRNEQEKMEKAAKSLMGGYVEIKDDRRMGTIKIAAEMGDPKLATSVVDAYVEGLQTFINKNSF